MFALRNAGPVKDRQKCVDASSRGLRDTVVGNLGLSAALTIVFLIWIHQARKAVRAFEESTSFAVLEGKTPDQVVKLLGKATDDMIRRNELLAPADDNREMIYSGPNWNECLIHFENDRVTKVDHWAK